MKLKPFILIVIFFIVCCNTGTRDKLTARTDKKTETKNKKHSIAILPFINVDSTFINELEEGLQKQLIVDLIILDKKALPAPAFYKPRQRYIADSLLNFLRKLNNNRFEKIIGVTTKDISTRKDDIENWGILGLGTCPGEVCVISTFRVGKNKISKSVFLRRMTTLALHELGHTYGLAHCPVETCLMKDAGGKMNLDDGDSYCDRCRNYLYENSILK